MESISLELLEASNNFKINSAESCCQSLPDDIIRNLRGLHAVSACNLQTELSLNKITPQEFGKQIRIIALDYIKHNHNENTDQFHLDQEIYIESLWDYPEKLANQIDLANEILERIRNRNY